MKNKLRSLSFSGIIGIGIGMPIAVLCMLLIDGYNGVVKEVLVWLIACALYGIVSNLIFGTDKLKLPVAAVIHCLACLTITISASAVIGYSDNILTLITAIGPVFVVIYAVVSTWNILSMKAQAKKANDALNERK